MVKFTETESCPKCGQVASGEALNVVYLTPEEATQPTDKLQIVCARCNYQWLVDPLDAVA